MSTSQKRIPMSPAMKRYQRRFWPAMIAYAVLLFTVVRIFETHPPAGALKYALAVAPAIPVVGVIVLLGLYLVEETDEFRRVKVIQAMLCGLGLVLTVTTVWGFLENLAGAPHMPLYLVFPIYCLGMGVAQPIIGWRYR